MHLEGRRGKRPSSDFFYHGADSNANRSSRRNVRNVSQVPAAGHASVFRLVETSFQESADFESANAHFESIDVKGPRRQIAERYNSVNSFGARVKLAALMSKMSEKTSFSR